MPQPSNRGVIGIRSGPGAIAIVLLGDYLRVEADPKCVETCVRL